MRPESGRDGVRRDGPAICERRQESRARREDRRTAGRRGSRGGDESRCRLRKVPPARRDAVRLRSTAFAVPPGKRDDREHQDLAKTTPARQGNQQRPARRAVAVHKPLRKLSAPRGPFHQSFRADFPRPAAPDFARRGDRSGRSPRLARHGHGRIRRPIGSVEPGSPGRTLRRARIAVSPDRDWRSRVKSWL